MPTPSRPRTAPLVDGSTGRPGFVARHHLWSAEQYDAAVRVHAALEGVDLVHLAFTDPHGLARSKTLTAQAFASALRNGLDYSPGPFLFDTGHALAVDVLDGPDVPGVGVPELAGAGNFVLVPDPSTFQVLPGGGADRPRTAWVLGDEYLRDGTAHPLSSRRALRQVQEAFRARGLTPVVGLEVEWYLTRRLPGPPGNAGNGFGLQGQAPAVEALNAGYQFNLDSAYDSVADHADPLALHLLALGLPLRSMEHESGPGQLETTFEPLAALDAADAMVLFRTRTKQFAARRGLHASFMSLPCLDGFDPSGWHLHQSAVDAAGRNVFAPDERTAPGTLAPQAAGYVAGLLERAAELCMLSVPTINGYHRLGVNFPLSPTRIGWSFEDRSAMVRVAGDAGSTHLENRIGEPCANPYLLMAAQLSAGLTGLTGSPAGTAGTAASEPAEAGAARGTLPQSLQEALAAFRAGRGAEVLGAPLAACLAALKQSEIERFEAWAAKEPPAPGEVTAWEHREYFGPF